MKSWIPLPVGANALKGNLALRQSVVSVLKDMVLSSDYHHLLRDVALGAVVSLCSAEETMLVLKTVADDQCVFEIMSDGAEIGRKRFVTSVTWHSTKLSVAINDWTIIIKLLASPMAAQCLDALVQDAHDDNISPADNLIIKDALFGLMPRLSRDEISSCVEAILRLSHRHASASCHQVNAIRGVAEGDCSAKTRGACVQLLGLLAKNNLHGAMESYCGLLEEDSQPEQPLLVRLAAGRSLGQGPLSQRGGMGLRCWLCALRLLQDGDMEVCDVTREAVLTELNETVSSSHICLENVLRLTFSLITSRHAEEKEWWLSLVEWIFPSYTGSLDDYEDEGGPLFKTDRDNEFMEPSLYARLAGIQLRRIRYRRLAQGDPSIAADMAELSNRTRTYVSAAFDIFAYRYQEDRLNAFNVMYCALVALETFGSIDDQSSNQILLQMRRDHIKRMSYGLLLQFRIAEQAVFGNCLVDTD
jgi:hypothetical protein